MSDRSAFTWISPRRKDYCKELVNEMHYRCMLSTGLQSTERRKVYFSADACDEDTFNAELGSTNCMANDAWLWRCLLRIIPWGRFVALRYIGKIWTFLHSAWLEIHEQSLRQLKQINSSSSPGVSIQASNYCDYRIKGYVSKELMVLRWWENITRKFSRDI